MAIGTYVSFAISQCVCYAQHLTRERVGEREGKRGGGTQYAISWQLGKQHDGWACLSRNAHKLLEHTMTTKKKRKPLGGVDAVRYLHAA